jgi:soluble lytic murein transglycosylase
MKRKTKRRVAVVIAMVLLLIMIAILYAFVYVPWAERRQYPLTYTDEIRASAEEFDLDPYLVAALIHRESSFQPEITSSVGAVGLMQVMPETGEWIGTSLGITDYDPARLTDPAFNTRMGCWYLHFLLERYNGQVVEALTAYNQGHGRVDGWLADPAISPDGKTLQTGDDGTTLVGLPEQIQDGKVYASLILKARDKYEALYPDGFAPKEAP